MAKIAPIPFPVPHPGSVINWQTTYEREPKILAGHARQAAMLAALALKGLRATDHELESVASQE